MRDTLLVECLLADAATGDVHADVESAQRLDRRGDRLLGALEVGDVTLEEVATDRLGDRGTLRAGTVEDGHLRTRRRDPLGRRPSHARCSSDHHHPCAVDLHGSSSVAAAPRLLPGRSAPASDADRTARLAEVTRRVFACENDALTFVTTVPNSSRPNHPDQTHPTKPTRPNPPRGTPHVRRPDHRRLPHAARHRQARQGGARPPASPAPRLVGPRRDRRAQRPRHVEGRRHHLGHEQPVRHAGRRPRAHGCPRCRLRRQGERRHARPLLWQRHHVVQPRRRHDRLRSRGHRHRGWHRHDVDLRGEPRPGPAAVHGRRQHAPALDPSAAAPGNLRRRDRHVGGHPPRRARRPGVRIAAACRARDRGRPIRAQPDHGAQRRRHRRPRPRRVPPPADDPRGSRRSRSRVRRPLRRSAR